MQSSNDSIKLLQITDTHLFAADEGSLLSVKTADSFSAVVNEVLRRKVGFDYILATGDISQDHSAAAKGLLLAAGKSRLQTQYGKCVTFTTNSSGRTCVAG